MNFELDQATEEDQRAALLSSKRGSLMKTQQSELDLPFNLRAVDSKIAPGSSADAAQFMQLQHKTGSRDWFRKCLILQRSGRKIPAVAPTAIAAAHLVPESERVYKVKDFRHGMVAFSDDPFDSNTAGHVYYICGRNKDDVILTWSNDVKVSGGVDCVPLSFYQDHWGDKLLFAATNLNGYDFSDFNKPAVPINRYEHLGDRYLAAIDDLKKIRRDKHSHDADRMFKILTRDIDRMEAHYKKFAA